MLVINGETELDRKPHVSRDLSSRYSKALKIERLLDLANRPQPMRMLEVGTGAGGIAHYFGTHEELSIQVDAVDVNDNRVIKEGYRYHEVADTSLPFDAQSFDVVLSNHVIEHVGEEPAQRAHLAELRRVLRPGGTGYLAVPNRWMLIEPHYNLALLSWWPHSWRSRYLRAMHRGQGYDCEPLQLRQVESFLGDTGFNYRNLCVDAIRLTLEIEHPDSVSTFLMRRIPDWPLKPLLNVIPTLIYQFSY